MKLQELGKLAPLLLVAPPVDETLDHGSLLGIQTVQTVTLHLGSAAVEKIEKQRNIVIHIHRLGCHFGTSLQKK